MPIEPTKRVFEIPRIIKREENQKSISQKKQKAPKKQKEGEARRIDIKV